MVAVAHGKIRLGRRASIHHDVDVGCRVDVDQSNLVTNGVVREVDQTNLPSLQTLAGNIDDAQLHAVERVGIVGGTQLPATHHARRDIQNARPLQATIHACGNIAHAT